MAQGSGDLDYTVGGTFRVPTPVSLPDVVDILIAGGGPAGTAAAVRARELGLSCLVIDYDDLMKRIRDYPKGKPIKAGYGGGDKLPFPPGGNMLPALHFDDIDKDEMVVQWKAKFKEFNLNAKVGSELTGLERKDNVWSVKTWNHRTGQEAIHHAKNLIIAIGAGVPRRFDIPGNTEGIAFRLTDPTKYVGAPALVLGGGTSAAEAAIAISKAKIAAEDPTSVYWSYRGDKLPKVSKALSEEFFDAYVGNGNVRYLPLSEPAAVFAGPDGKDYVSLRVDRKVIEGRPAESIHLEIPKEHVVACIGEEVPFKLLQSFGIKVALVNNRPMILLNKEGESSLPGVFLVGDLRGPKFLRCADFNDSTTYETVTMKRNIKAAMWDAVQAVEVVGDRMGIAGAKMAVAVLPEVVAAGPPAAAAAPAAKAAKAASPAPAAVVAPKPSEPSGAREAPMGVQLVSLLPDGTPEEQFPVSKEKVTIGRTGADIASPEDVYMADVHASVVNRGGQYTLEDAGSPSGVWARVQGVDGRPIAEGDVVWIGAQILMASKTGGAWTVAHHNSEGAFVASHPVGDKGLFVGRGSQATLDPNDMSLSRRHAQFRVDASGLKVYDLASTNGTYVRINKSVPLASGDEFRAGSKRFRFESFAPIEKLKKTDVVVEAPPEALATPAAAAAPAAAAPAAGAAPAAVPAGAAAATIEHAQFPASFAVAPGQDVLHGFFEYLKARYPGLKTSKTGEPAEHQEEPLCWECKVGMCGLCVVQVLDGADNLVPPDKGSPEMNTLEFKAAVEPDPKQYRLACVAKIKGPVKLAIPS